MVDFSHALFLYGLGECQVEFELWQIFSAFFIATYGSLSGSDFICLYSHSFDLFSTLVFHLAFPQISSFLINMSRVHNYLEFIVTLSLLGCLTCITFDFPEPFHHLWTTLDHLHPKDSLHVYHFHCNHNSKAYNDLIAEYIFSSNQSSVSLYNNSSLSIWSKACWKSILANFFVSLYWAKLTMWNRGWKNGLPNWKPLWTLSKNLTICDVNLRILYTIC